MGLRNIGEIINTLRKGKGVTQEELANHVGVSTQAVSKWECGGVPDTELIPIIADYFEVSIDTLFGREINDYGDIYSMVAKKFEMMDREKQFYEAFEMIWAIQQVLGECEIELIDYINPAYSQIRRDTGVSLFNLKKQSRYAFFMPESENRSEWLLDEIDYVSLFKMLSEQDTFDSLVLLYKNYHISFTENFLVKSLKITIERARDIINSFVEYSLIEVTEVEIDDEIKNVYKLRNNPEFIVLLTFAREMIKLPNSFYIFNGGREKPYLK